MNINFKYNIDDYHLYEVLEIESTNTYLKENYDKYQDKTILLAHKQTKGRGRLDHIWKSNNDLTFSFLFKSKQGYMIPAIAVVKALELYDIKTLIKWPNDIYYDFMKISGILVEDIYEDTFKASIVGIGVNLSDKLEYNVSGLGNIYNINKYNLLKSITKEYEKLINKNDDEILKIYKKYSLVLGRKISYNNEIYEVIDVDLSGRLVAKNESGITYISYGDIDIKSSLIDKITK